MRPGLDFFYVSGEKSRSKAQAALQAFPVKAGTRINLAARRNVLVPDDVLDGVLQSYCGQHRAQGFVLGCFKAIAF
jgi:hypothetical protein